MRVGHGLCVTERGHLATAGPQRFYELERPPVELGQLLAPQA